MKKKSRVIHNGYFATFLLTVILITFISTLSLLVTAEDVGSASFNISNPTITEVASGNTSSVTYSINTIIESISSNISSSSYQSCLGFFCTSTTTPNTAPSNLTTILINSTDGTNKTLQDLNCFTNITDPDSGDLLNVTIRWYNNNIINLTIDYNNSYANNTAFNATLNNANTSKGENWTCSIRIYDGTDYSSWTNTSNNLTILNTLPTITLIAPSDGNITTDRTPIFNWSGSDDDNDTLEYEINISLDAGSLCVDPDRYIDKNILGTEINYTPPTYLKCLWDNLDNYTWTVRAHDGEGFGNWNESARYILINSDISVSLPIASVNFSNMDNEDKDNTTDQNPEPLILQNNGNALLNISINFTNLWETSTIPNKSFQFKVRNTTDGCFNFTGTNTAWKNASLTTIPIIHQLNFTGDYQTGCNNASIDLHLEVPINEPPGNKSSIITLTSSLGEHY